MEHIQMKNILNKPVFIEEITRLVIVSSGKMS